VLLAASLFVCFMLAWLAPALQFALAREGKRKRPDQLGSAPGVLIG
jgi:hypothetical protein